MKNRIESIGRFRYLWTIIIGRNKRFFEFGDVQAGKTIRGDFIVTVGKRAVIATQIQNKKRAPIIVKKWRKVAGFDKKELADFLQTKADIVECFIDSDHNDWSYYHSDEGDNFITCRDSEGTLIYEFK